MPNDDKVKALHEYDLKCYGTPEIKEMFYGKKD